MFSRLELSIVSIAYLLSLFAIAFYGDRYFSKHLKRSKALIIGLGLGTSFTAWTFFGTPVQALEKGWYIPPTILGTVGVLLFGTVFIKRMIKLGKEHRSTSIAGFLSSRYDNSRALALIITSVTAIGLLPYLSIQLKATAMSFELLTGTTGLIDLQENYPSFWNDTTFVVAMLMAIFSIIFGTRHIDQAEHQNGLMLAVAFESLVKLIALCAVGFFAGYQLFDGSIDVITQAINNPEFQQVLAQQNTDGYLAGVVLGMVVFVCLPRFFHVLVVESNGPNDANTAQWVFPLYASILVFFVILIILTGFLKSQGHTVNTEMFFLWLPMSEGKTLLSLLGYIGGLSAATSMIILSTVTLSIMICNDMVAPVILRRKYLSSPQAGIGGKLLNIRRYVIIGVLLLSYGFYRIIGTHADLGSLGIISLSLIGQFSPTFIASLYWSKRHKYGAIAGITAGTLIWSYASLTPGLAQTGWVSTDVLTSGPFGISWLIPHALFGLTDLDPLSNGVFCSLGVNALVFIGVSLVFHHRQKTLPQESDSHIHLTNQDLLFLASQFLGEQQAKLSISHYYQQRQRSYNPRGYADSNIISFIESLLAGVIGPSSAKQILKLSYTQSDKDKTSEDLVEETSRALKFSRELLQSSIDNMNQGISVVDNNYRLVVWNQQFTHMFKLPEQAVYVGSPMEEVIDQILRFNTSNKGNEVTDSHSQIAKFTQGYHHIQLATSSGNKVIEIRGEPIPQSGYVTTYTDITDHQSMVDELKNAKENLEQRVEERTTELQDTNQQLKQAKLQAESANQSKTRFLAAASHDLAQPLNAAKLFATALQTLNLKADPKELIDNLANSLQNAENLISDLFDIAKIDAGIIKTQISIFPIQQLLESLNQEFNILAKEKGLSFVFHPSSLHAHTDRKQLRRILQNLISNAIRYTQEGRIVIGCRRQKDQIVIQVWDTGIGIPEESIEDIFTEFKQLKSTSYSEGTGLGLATVSRLCQSLKLPISVKSNVNSGSVFQVTVPQATNISGSEPRSSISTTETTTTPQKLHVLCIDNEESILKGMHALLSSWGYEATCCKNLEEAKSYFTVSSPPDVIFADYHLDNDETGIDVVNGLYREWQDKIPCVIISADQTDQVKTRCKQQGFLFQRKPVKPNALRAALSRFESQAKHR